MRDLFGKLGRTGSAYAAGSIAQKAIAVALLPIYTRYVTSAGYGAVEVLLQTTFAIALFVRFGVVEAMFRYYTLERAPERRADVIRAAGAFLVGSASVSCAIVMVAAEPLSRLLLARPDAGLVRIAAAGMWALIVGELLLAIFRVEQRARAYMTAASANIAVTIVVSVWLVVFERDGAEGLLIGNFAGTAAIVVGLVFVHRAYLHRGPIRPLLRPLLRFGGPAMSAELSLYAVNVIDRIAIVHFAGLAEAGLYSIAMKLSQGIVLLLQGFNLAWAPLAYSIDDDAQARRFYARVFTYLLLAGGVVLLATSLLAPWIVRALAAPAFYRAHEAVPLISLAVVLYALYVTMIVAVGRVRQTKVLLIAALSGLAVDALLLVLLVPPLGMIGAAIALAACFVVALPVLYLFVRRLFPIPLEWRRLATIAVATGAVYGLGALATPESGAVAFVTRAALIPLFLLLLWPAGFFDETEVRQLQRLRARRRLATPPSV